MKNKCRLKFVGTIEIRDAKYLLAVSNNLIAYGSENKKFELCH